MIRKPLDTFNLQENSAKARGGTTRPDSVPSARVRAARDTLASELLGIPSSNQRKIAETTQWCSFASSIYFDWGHSVSCRSQVTPTAPADTRPRATTPDPDPALSLRPIPVENSDGASHWFKLRVEKFSHRECRAERHVTDGKAAQVGRQGCDASSSHLPRQGRLPTGSRT